MAKGNKRQEMDYVLSIMNRKNLRKGPISSSRAATAPAAVDLVLEPQDAVRLGEAEGARAAPVDLEVSLLVARELDTVGLCLALLESIVDEAVALRRVAERVDGNLREALLCAPFEAAVATRLDAADGEGGGDDGKGGELHFLKKWLCF